MSRASLAKTIILFKSFFSCTTNFTILKSTYLIHFSPQNEIPNFLRHKSVLTSRIHRVSWTHATDLALPPSAPGFVGGRTLSNLLHRGFSQTRSGAPRVLERPCVTSARAGGSPRGPAQPASSEPLWVRRGTASGLSSQRVVKLGGYDPLSRTACGLAGASCRSKHKVGEKTQNSEKKQPARVSPGQLLNTPAREHKTPTSRYNPPFRASSGLSARRRGRTSAQARLPGEAERGFRLGWRGGRVVDFLVPFSCRTWWPLLASECFAGRRSTPRPLDRPWVYPSEPFLSQRRAAASGGALQPWTTGVFL